MRKQHSQRFLELVADAKSRITETDVPTIMRRLDDGAAFRLIDVREESEWHNGHLPGATHLGKGIIERDIEKQVADSGTEIVLYCGGGYRSALVADALQRMGYTNVLSMDGGFSGWVEAGGEVVRQAEG
jgi:rhodanese-related sulfurtransferase